MLLPRVLVLCWSSVMLPQVLGTLWSTIPSALVVLSAIILQQTVNLLQLGNLCLGGGII
jgi:hypothetical protein